MKYSFLIPTLNRPNDIKHLFDDIAHLEIPSGITFEVLLFNDGRDLATESLVRSWQGFPVQYLMSAERVNSCISRNRLLDVARGEWIIFLDDDVRLKPDFIRQVAGAANQFSGFSFRMELPNKQHAGFSINQLLEKFLCGKILPALGHFVGGFDTVYRTVRSVEHLPGANMIFRRETIGDIRFDDKIGTGTGYLDDADFSHSIKSIRHIPLGYFSDYTIVHLQTPSGGNRQLNRREWYYYYQNHKFRFFAKHYSSLYRPLIFLFNFGEAVVRSVAYKTNLLPTFWRALRES